MWFGIVGRLGLLRQDWKLPQPCLVQVLPQAVNIVCPCLFVLSLGRERKRRLGFLCLSAVSSTGPHQMLGS